MKKHSFILIALFALICILPLFGCFNQKGVDTSATTSYTIVVSYYAEDGSITTKRVTFEDKYDNKIPSSYVGETGIDYTFVGFFNEENGEGDMLFDSTGAQCGYGIKDDMVVYAYRRPNKYTVKFYDYNERLLETEKDVEAGTLLNYPAPTYSNGLDFIGWKNGEETLEEGFTFLPSKLTPNDDNTYVFKAITEKHEYNVYYDYFDSNYEYLNKNETHYFGDKLTNLPEEDDGEKRIAYWSSSPYGDEFKGQVTEDLTLYAVWMEYRTVKLILPDSKIETLYIYNDGKEVNLSNYTLNGYDFYGFYTSQSYSGLGVTSLSYYGSEKTLYGRFEKITYTLSFFSSSGETFDSITYQIGDDIDLPTKVTAETGYTFKGWTSDGKTYFTTLPKDFFGNETLEAFFEANKYTVSLIVDGSNYKKEQISYQNDFALSVPTKENYVFNGWIDKDGNYVTDANGNSTSPYALLEGTTYFASFEGKPCTITFDSMEGSAVDAITVKYGEKIDLSTVSSTKTGSFMDGWYNEDFTISYSGNITVKSDMKLFAKWIESTPISNLDGLLAIKDNPEGNYHLVGNVNMKGNEWTPIDQFKGILNGNGYKIYNFTMTQNTAKQAFIISNSGTIKNIQFDKVNLSANVNWNDNGTENGYGIICVSNGGTIDNVKVTDSTMSISQPNTYGIGIYSGGICGSNWGVISSSFAQLTLTYNISASHSAKSGSYNSTHWFGGISGLNYNQIKDCIVNVSESFTLNEGAYGSSNFGYASTTCYVTNTSYIGGASGANFAHIENVRCDCSISYESNAGQSGNACVYRNEYIGGICGYQAKSSDNQSIISDVYVIGCASSGEITYNRYGSRADSDSYRVGGISGQINGGMMNNLLSEANINVPNYGYAGGIVSYINSGARVMNVAYYGTITSKTSAVGGLCENISGSLSQGFYKGTIIGGSNAQGDIAQCIGSAGSCTKMINCGNLNKSFNSVAGSTDKIFSENEITKTVFFTDDYLFEETAMLDSDYWAVVDGTDVYMTTFAEGHTHHFGEMTCSDQECEEEFCHFIQKATTSHSFTNYVSDENEDPESGYYGTKTAKCDYGCGTTDTIEVKHEEE